MNNKLKSKGIQICLCFIMIYCTSCSSKVVSQKMATPKVSQMLPASDQDNKEGWILNKELSDEFEGTAIDTNRWFVEGLNGDYYIWKGRAPSQFAPHNVIVEDGKLKLRTQWEPDFPYAKKHIKKVPLITMEFMKGNLCLLQQQGYLQKKISEWIYGNKVQSR